MAKNLIKKFKKKSTKIRFQDLDLFCRVGICGGVFYLLMIGVFMLF